MSDGLDNTQEINIIQSYMPAEEQKQDNNSKLFDDENLG